MLYALATPGSAFQPSIKKPQVSWRLRKFKKIYMERRGLSNPSSTESSLNDNSSLIGYIKFD